MACTLYTTPLSPQGTGMIFFPETVRLCVLLPQRLILCLRGGCLLQVILWPKSPGWSNSFRGRKLIGCCWWKKRLVDFFVWKKCSQPWWSKCECNLSIHLVQNTGAKHLVQHTGAKYLVQSTRAIHLVQHTSAKYLVQHTGAIHLLVVSPLLQFNTSSTTAQVPLPVPVPVVRAGTGVTATAIQHRCFLSFSTYDTVQLFELITSLCKFLNRLGSLQHLSLQQHQYILANLIGFSTYHKTPKCDFF